MRYLAPINGYPIEYSYSRSVDLVDGIKDMRRKAYQIFVPGRRINSKYGKVLGSEVSRGLKALARFSMDKNLIRDSADTIMMYEGRAADTIANTLDHMSYLTDIRSYLSMLRDPEIVDFVNSYPESLNGKVVENISHRFHWSGSHEPLISASRRKSVKEVMEKLSSPRIRDLAGRSTSVYTVGTIFDLALRDDNNLDVFLSFMDNYVGFGSGIEKVVRDLVEDSYNHYYPYKNAPEIAKILSEDIYVSSLRNYVRSMRPNVDDIADLGYEAEENAKRFFRHVIDNVSRQEDRSRVAAVAGTVNKMYERGDFASVVSLVDSLDKMSRCFGDNTRDILDYAYRTRDRKIFDKIKSIEGPDNVRKIFDTLESSSPLGNKQVRSLVQLAANLDFMLKEKIKVPSYVSGKPIVPGTLQQMSDSVNNSIGEYIRKKGITDPELATRLIKWLKSDDETAMKVLKGERVEKPGPSASYPIGVGSLDVESMVRELYSYSGMMGLDIKVPAKPDIVQIKQIAESMVSEARKKNNIRDDVYQEVKPNLSRIISSTSIASGKYVLSIDPSDAVGQLESLHDVESCLSPSPGGVCSNYTKEYIKNPNTFFAVIKNDNGRAIGRVTVFRGRKGNNDVIARTSKIYSKIAFDENDVDDALRKYATDSGAEFITDGTIEVPGIRSAYDDFISRGLMKRGKIKIKRN